MKDPKLESEHAMVATIVAVVGLVIVSCVWLITSCSESVCEYHKDASGGHRLLNPEACPGCCIHPRRDDT